MINLANLLKLSQMGIFVKAIFLFVNFAFFLFVLIIIRQVSTMSTIVNDTNASSIVKAGAFILLIITVSLFLTALVIL